MEFEPEVVAVAEPEALAGGGPDLASETAADVSEEVAVGVGHDVLPAPPDPSVPGLPCIRHRHRFSSTRCSRCGGPFCDDCLIQVGSSSRPRTLCVDCALLAGGVRVSRRRRASQRRRRR
ncbi:MAG: hypothetical protein M5U31_13510 [Acidimicrobiia bacterium]|nr:hypothetical protein [Acidimicrobiia bacterium]